MARKIDYSKVTKKKRVVSVTVEFIMETNEDDIEVTADRVLKLKTLPDLNCLPIPAKVQAAVLWDKDWSPELLKMMGRRRR